MPKGYVIDAAGIKTLREDHEILRKRITHLERKLSSTIGAGVRVTTEYAKVTEQIEPCEVNSATLVKETFGSGKAWLYKLVQDDEGEVTFEKMTNNHNKYKIEVDVYNSSLVPVPVGAYVRITRDFRSGLWLVGEIETSLALTGESGIPAQHSRNAGVGEVSLVYIDEASTLNELTETGKTLKVYNFSSDAVAAEKYITIKRCSLDGKWVVDAEDCG